MSTGLVAFGSAAVFVVYATGFLKTKAAAAKFDEPVGPRRAAVAPGDAAAGAAAVVPAATTVADLSSPRGATPTSPNVTLALPTDPANRPLPEVAAKAAAGATAPASAATLVASAAAAPTKTDAAASATASTTPTSPVTASAPAPVAAAEPAPVASVPPAATPVPTALYKDGTYTGWGSCRHGDIQAQVVIAAGRIASASIAQCLTRYSCSWISPLPPQVSQRQSAEVDYVSGATQSAIAFYGALVDALAKAK